MFEGNDTETEIDLPQTHEVDANKCAAKAQQTRGMLKTRRGNLMHGLCSRR